MVRGVFTVKYIKWCSLSCYYVECAFIDVESNRSRITCIMVVAESDWIRIQNLPNTIGCGVKKKWSPHTSATQATVVETFCKKHQNKQL